MDDDKESSSRHGLLHAQYKPTMVLESDFTPTTLVGLLLFEDGAYPLGGIQLRGVIMR